MEAKEGHEPMSPVRGLRHPLDILVEVSRRKLGMSLELRRKIIAAFGCFRGTTVVNVMGLDKVNRGHIIDREEP